MKNPFALMPLSKLVTSLWNHTERFKTRGEIMRPVSNPNNRSNHSLKMLWYPSGKRISHISLDHENLDDKNGKPFLVESTALLKSTL